MENAQGESERSLGRKGRTQVSVVVDIPIWREASVRPVTRDEEDGYLRMKHSEEKAVAESLEASQHATTKRTDTVPLFNVVITT